VTIVCAGIMSLASVYVILMPHISVTSVSEHMRHVFIMFCSDCILFFMHLITDTVKSAEHLFYFFFVFKILYSFSVSLFVMHLLHYTL